MNTRSRKKRDKDTMTKQSHPMQAQKIEEEKKNIIFSWANMKISCKMEGHAKNKIRQNDRRKMRRPTLTTVVGPSVYKKYFSRK